MADVLTIEDAMQTVLDSILGYHTDVLTRAWTEAWADVHTDLIDAVTAVAAGGTLTPEALARDHRIAAGLAATRDALDTLAALAGETITADIDRVLGLGQDGEIAMLRSLLPPNHPSPALVDPAQLEAILLRSTEQITALSLPISADTDQAVRSQLIRGILSGDNPRHTAELMVAATGERFTGGLARALNISRTEILDAMRSAQRATDLANPGIVTGWVWSAHLGARTCRSCIAMHGTVYPVEEPGPLDHQSGRCARVPKTASWAALGFPDIPEPPSSIPDAADWFDSLTGEEQRGILGARGWDAWRRGDYPMSDWAQRRSTDGWRDSYAPTKPPKEA